MKTGHIVATSFISSWHLSWRYISPITPIIMTTQFSLELRVARKNAGLTQYDVAHLLSTKQSNISRFEKGSRMPSQEQLIKLSLIYGKAFENLYAEMVHDARRALLNQLETLPHEKSGRTSSTFNRPETLERLRERLLVEISDYDITS